MSDDESMPLSPERADRDQDNNSDNIDSAEADAHASTSNGSSAISSSSAIAPATPAPSSSDSAAAAAAGTTDDGDEITPAAPSRSRRSSDNSFYQSSSQPASPGLSQDYEDGGANHFESHASGASTPLLSESAHEDAKQSIRAKDPKFYSIVCAIENAIDLGVLPERVAQGSSGSYFCKNADGDIMGIFKPKNEEPYGQLNPKWTKWLQKHCMPCCFGRSCLLPNQGYLSEAGASIVDCSLSLGVVPKTKVIKLVSPSFFYSRYDRMRAQAVKRASERFPDAIGKRMRQGLPLKVGSLQLFVRGYKDASLVLRRLDYNKLAPDVKTSLQLQFESMVVLDYIIRNTDRGNDNWLIKHVNEEGERETITIAAIDNGLAFPFKHPDNWRAYPYHWAWLPMAKVPFSKETVEHVLPLLDDEDFVEDLCDQLQVLFCQDPGFSRTRFEQQMGVMRGQILNLRKAMQERRSPLQLVQMPPAFVVIQREDKRKRRYKQIIADRMPFFSWC